MAEKGDYRINNFYQGGYSSLNSEDYSPTGIYTGFKLPASRLGAPTKADSANQLAQINMLLNQGIIPIEVGVMDPNVFDAIPKEHFKDMNRMAKLTGADISVHAPIIEPSGMGEQGWNEAARVLAEKQIKSVIDRTAPLNERGGMSINFHGSGGLQGKEYTMTPEGKKEKKIVVVNQETGERSLVKEELRYVPGTNKFEDFSPAADEVETLNNTNWRNSLSQLMHNKEDAEKLLNQNMNIIPKETWKKIEEKSEEYQKQGKIYDVRKYLEPHQVQALERLRAAKHFLSDTHSAVNSMFTKAYKFGTEEDKAKLFAASEKMKQEIKTNPGFEGTAQALSGVISSLEEVRPQVFVPSEEFALEHSSKTFANAALHAYKKFKDKAPTINIENMFSGMAFSHGEELNQLIEKTRQRFVEQATQEGISRSTAKQQAEKLIGITLDVGHLNVAKKQGFKDEDLLKEVKKMSKNIKHVHLTDNFGYGDTHLAPGMGNVPFKQILEELEKKGYSGKNIVEAPGVPQHFGVSPLPYTLEAFGSPLYQGGPSVSEAVGLMEGYSGGFGSMLPQVHYESFGGGFSNLPSHVGGSRMGAGSRMSGRGME